MAVNRVNIGAFVACVLVCTTIATPATPASAPAAPATQPRVQVRIDGLDDDPTLKRDVLAVCRDVAEICAARIGRVPPLGAKLFVIRQAPDDTPRADLRGLPKEYWVNITCLKTRSYSQIVFQVGHEVGHHYVDPTRGGWFVESVVTALSYACLADMQAQWQRSPPFANWAAYAPHFGEYREQEIASILRKAGLKDVEQAKAWVRERLPELVRQGKVDRPAQGVCAIVIERAMRDHPDSWSALTKLGAAVTGGHTDLPAWRRSATPGEAKLIDELAETFGPVLSLGGPSTRPGN